MVRGVGLPQEQNVSGACASGQKPRSLFHYDIHRNRLEISSMFRETACKEENPGVFPLFAYALQEYGRQGEETTQPE